MAWNEPGGGKQRDPWSGGGGAGGGGPDFERWLRNLNDRIGRLFGGGRRGGNGGGAGGAGGAGVGGIVLLLVGALLLWSAFDAFTVIEERERGVVLRFGKAERLMNPGLNFKWPRPIEEVRRVDFTSVRSVTEQARMLTRDENLVVLKFNVQYRVADPNLFLFGTRNPDDGLRLATEAAVRQVIGANTLDEILIGQRAVLVAEVRQVLQTMLADYGTGLELTGLQRYSTEDYTGVSQSSGDSSTFTANTTSGESIGRAILRFRPNDRWSFETGGEVAYNFIDSATAYSENGIPIPLPSSSVKVEELRGEVFGQATWRPDPTLTIEGGLRVEVSEISQSGDSDLTKSFVYPKPRIQATWTPWTGHQFRFRAEREVGQLDFGDFIASADIDIGQVEGGNPDLEPQKQTVIEAIYERRFWGEGVFDATYQYAEVEDVVDVIPLTGGFDGVGNIGDGTARFFQLRLTLPTDRLGIPNGRFQTRASWSSTSVLDPVTGEERRFQGNQAFGCGVNFTQDLAGGRWSWGFDHGCNVDKGRAFRGREVRAFYAEPGVGAFVQWKPERDLTVRVDLGNASDRTRGYDREIYTGPRDTAPLAFREVRRTQMSPWLFIQIRKTF